MRADSLSKPRVLRKRTSSLSEPLDLLPSASLIDITDVARRSGLLAAVGRYHCDRTLEQDVELENSRVLGEGNACVVLGRRRDGGAPCAVKSLSKVGRSVEALKELKNEAEIHLEMDHPHILRLQGVYETPADVHFVMEPLFGGELYEYAANTGALGEVECAKIVKQMLHAVAYMHGRGVLHLDLKLENFMFEREDHRHIKVIDFGFARRMDGYRRLRGEAGTVHYMAPENLTGSFDDKADMWSLGVVVYILLYRTFPWTEEEEIVDQLTCPNPPAYWASRVGQAGKRPSGNFVRSLLSWAPVGRLSAVEALRHPWFYCLKIRQQERLTKGLGQSFSIFAAASPLRKACLMLVARALVADEERLARDDFLTVLEAVADSQRVCTLAKTDIAAALKVVGSTGFLFKTVDRGLLEGLGALDRGGGRIWYSDFLAASLADQSCAKARVNEVSLRVAFGRFEELGSVPGSEAAAAPMSFGAFCACVRGVEGTVFSPSEAATSAPSSTPGTSRTPSANSSAPGSYSSVNSAAAQDLADPKVEPGGSEPLAPVTRNDTPRPKDLARLVARANVQPLEPVIEAEEVRSFIANSLAESSGSDSIAFSAMYAWA